MTIFKNILERMAAGQMSGIYANPVLTLEHGEILFYEGTDPDGVLIIDSVNQVPVCGTVHSLHPALSVLETAFQGRTEIHYSLDRKYLSGCGNLYTDGLLICCNGKEFVIPLHVVNCDTEEPDTSVQSIHSPDNDNKEESAYIKEKRHVAGLERAYLSLLCAVKSGSGQEEKTQRVKEVSLHVSALCALRPECIRYRLFEAILAAKKDNLSIAKGLERRMRNIITSARKKHPTEFCLLRYLQYEIARMSRAYEEAGSKKTQLIGYLEQVLNETQPETEILCLYGEESLNILESDPVEFWEQLHELYERGNNSPFLFYYGICALASPSMEVQTDLFTDSFILRCLNFGTAYGFINREMASRIVIGGNSLGSPYLLRLYRRLYELYPERELLLPLCRLMIRMDIRNERAFPLYQKAVAEQLKPARLFDYYMYALPDNFDKPVEREILMYYSADSYVNPAIYLKLCVNILQFYTADKEIMDLYSPHMEAFIRTQIAHGRSSENLALMVDSVITPEVLEQELAEGIMPMLPMSDVYADLPDGTTVVYDNGIYAEPSQGTFRNGKAIISMIGGCGKLHLLDKNNRKIGGISLEITPLIQNEALIKACYGEANHSPQMELLRHNKWLKQYFDEYEENDNNIFFEAREPEDFRLCVSYIKNPELSEELKRNILRYLLEKISADELDHLDDQTEYADIIYANMDLLNNGQAANGFTYLVDHGRTSDAARLWNRLSGEGLDRGYVQRLAHQLMDSCGNTEIIVREKILLSLLEEEILDEPMLEFLAQGGYRPMEIQIRILMTCRNQNVNHQDLSAQILLRQLLNASPDWSVLQTVYEELVNHEQFDLLNHAAMNMICYAYLFWNIRPEINLAAFAQGEIIFSGKTDSLSEYTKLAFLKQMQTEDGQIESVAGIRRKICLDVIDKKMILDFVQREAIKLGLPGYPVFTVNLSEYGEFKENMMDMVRTHPEKLRAEYRIEGQNQVYSCRLIHVCECLYTAQLICFAGEHAQYRISFGEKTTDWFDIEPWNDPIRNPQGLSERYCLLQNMSVSLQKEELTPETMQNYEVTMTMIHEYGKVL